MNAGVQRTSVIFIGTQRQHLWSIAGWPVVAPCPLPEPRTHATGQGWQKTSDQSPARQTPHSSVARSLCPRDRKPVTVPSPGQKPCTRCRKHNKQHTNFPQHPALCHPVLVPVPKHKLWSSLPCHPPESRFPAHCLECSAPRTESAHLH